MTDTDRMTDCKAPHPHHPDDDRASCRLPTGHDGWHQGLIFGEPEPDLNFPGDFNFTIQESSWTSQRNTEMTDTPDTDTEAEILALRYILAYNHHDHDALVAVAKDLGQGEYDPRQIVIYMADIAVGYARMVSAYEHGDADYHSADGAAEVIERSLQHALDRNP